MSPMNLQGFFEDGSKLIPAAGGVVRTAAPLIQLELAWTELSAEELAQVTDHALLREPYEGIVRE